MNMLNKPKARECPEHCASDFADTLPFQATQVIADMTSSESPILVCDTQPHGESCAEVCRSLATAFKSADLFSEG